MYGQLISLGAMMAFGYLMSQQGITNNLDVRKFYWGSEAISYLLSLTPDESQRYLTKEYFDLFFILSFSSLFFLLMVRFFPRIKYLWLLALLPGFFDLIETGTIISLLMTQKYPRPLDWLGLVTAVKWLLAYLVMIIIVVGGLKELVAKGLRRP